MTESPQGGNGIGEDRPAEPGPQPYDRPVPPPPPRAPVQRPLPQPVPEPAHEPGHEPGVQPYGPPPGWAAQPGQYGPSPAGFGPPHGQGQQFGPGEGPHPTYGPGPGYGPPGYGPPQYAFPGPPYAAAPPPQRRRRLALVLSLVALAVLIVAGVAVALTVGPTVLNRTAVEHDVGAQFQQLEGVAVELRCPDRMTVQSGAQYTCSGTTADGEKVTLAIQIQSTGSRPKYVWTEP